MAKITVRFLSICLGTAALVTGCSTQQPFVVEQPNLRGKQEPATITVSDPQVYARETLVNDRLRETRLLRSLLEESQVIAGEKDFRKKFTAHINRDLATLTALRVGASATIDPLEADRRVRQAEKDELDSQIERYGQLAELADARRNYLDARRNVTDPGSSPGDPGDDAAGSGADAGNSGTTPTPDPAGQPPAAVGSDDPGATPLTVQNTASNGGNGSGPGQDEPLDFDLAKLKALREIPVTKTSIEPDPLDQFRDLQAYRTELRQAMSEIGLDDLHDYDGNALYRMQFKLTSAPGRHADKFGVARLTFHPPKPLLQEVRDLYYTWLSHVTFRMNQPRQSGDGYVSDDRYARLGSSLFRMVQVPYVPKKESYYQGQFLNVDPCFSGFYESQVADEFLKCRFLKIAVPPLAFSQLQGLIDRGKCRFLSPDIWSFGVAESFGKFRCSEMLEKFEPMSCDTSYQAQFTASLRQLMGGSSNWGGQLSTLAETTLSRWLREADTDFQCKGSAGLRVPTAFFNLIDESLTSGDSIYAYNVLPLNRHQRMSDVMRTASSFEVGLNLVATLVGSLTDGKAGIDYLRQTMGNVESIQRNPLIVGFADRVSPFESDRKGTAPFGNPRSTRLSRNDRSQLPQVGWILGPALRTNAHKKRLELTQQPVARRVAADVSMPGWWPHVRVKLETGWVGNWRNSSEMLRTNSSQSIHSEFFDVSMPLNTADLDALTNYLSRRTMGSNLQQLNIRLIEPGNISACAKEVEILVEGANVWRSAEVFLGGVAAKEVRILPNMDGIAARFNMDELFSTQNLANIGLGLQHYVTLGLWTRNGSDSRELRLVGSRHKDGCVSKTSVATSPRAGRAEIVLAAPTVIDACAKEASFVTKVYRPTVGYDQPTFMLGSTIATEVKDLEPSLRGWGQTFQVTFRGGPFAKAPDSPNIALSVVEKGEISSVPVMLRKCGATPTPLEASIAGSVLINSAAPTNKVVKLNVNLKIAKGEPPKTAKLAVRVTGSASKKWYESKESIPTALNDKKIAVVQFEIKPDPAFDDGDKLEFAIVDTSNAVMGTQTKELKGNLIYYSSADTASVTGQLKEASGKITLELKPPKNWETAYPAALKAEIQITPKKYGLKADPVSLTRSEISRIKVTPKTNLLSEDRAKGDVTLLIALKPETAGTVVPTVKPSAANALKLKKTAAATPAP